MQVQRTRLPLASSSVRSSATAGLITMACLIGILSSVATRAESMDDSFFTHLHTEKAMANVTILPDRVGPVEITIQLETADKEPLTAAAVSVTLTNMESGVEPQTAQAVRHG
jgi:copper transport protein